MKVLLMSLLLVGTESLFAYVLNQLNIVLGKNSCISCDLAGANFSGRDLSNINLSGANLSYSNLRGANLTGTILTGANLTGADFSIARWVDGSSCQEGSIGHCKR